MTFIEEILQDILQKHNNQKDTINWREFIFLFPSKRPASFLKQELSKTLKNPIWSPQCLAIADFITQYSQLSTIDNMSLVFELYQCYLDQMSADKKPFELLDFYPLGETLIADFGDIDKDLVDAKALFSNFSQLQEIEATFALEDEQMDSFRAFWKHFSAKEPQKMQTEFLELWQMMGALYFDFRIKLQQQNRAYAGLAERVMAENFSEIIADLSGKTIAICGFNALTKAEIKLFKEIETVATVYYYFDYDLHYMQAHHEAGHFMRRNLKNLKATENKQIDNRNQLSSKQKNINLTSASGTTGMVQALYHDVLALDPAFLNEETGIILPDENALRACIEVLPSLPTVINITMGMPLQSTGIWSLVKTLFLLQANYNQNTKAFLYRDVLQVLQHAELQIFNDTESENLQYQIVKQNMIYCGEAWLQKWNIHKVFLDLFTASSASAVFTYIQKALASLEKNLEETTIIKQSILINTYQQCTRFSDLYLQYLQNAEIKEIWTIFKKATKAKNIAFEGEPLKGVQLMGLLESRSIDFKRLYILSVNEGVIPKTSRHQSLIPFGIRKAFGMNTFREDDAMSAYYFYRMLQRASDINLYYNTDTDSDSKGEPSRFIVQIAQELPNFNIIEKHFSLEGQQKTNEHLSIVKTYEVMQSLAQYEVENGEAKRPLSPSALATYIKSPVQFYLRYVANFSEQEEVLEEMDPITLGNIVHNTLEELYSPHLGQEITAELVRELKENKLKPALEKQLEQEMNLKPEHLQGRNLLFYNICQKLCSNVLNTDAKTKGLKILQLEFDALYYDMELETNNGHKIIRLKGQFDRLDELNGQTRVVDYKTGNVELIKTEADIFKKSMEDGKYAAMMQTLFYTLVYLKNQPTSQVLPVIYHLKSAENMVKPVRETGYNLLDLQDFETILKTKLEEIWDSSIPFAFDDYEEESKYLMMEVL